MAAENQRAMYRGVVHYKDDNTRKWLAKRKDIVEFFDTVCSADGLRLVITIRSWFGEHLLRQLHDEVFGRGFEFRLHREQNGDWVSVYEYIDPAFAARVQ